MKRALRNRQSALRNPQDPLWPLSLTEERVRERFRDRLSQPARSAGGTAAFRPTSPAARDARGDLPLVKGRSEKAPRVELRKALSVEGISGKAP